MLFLLFTFYCVFCKKVSKAIPLIYYLLHFFPFGDIYADERNGATLNRL